MSATLIARAGNTVTLEVKFDLTGSMLEAERGILNTRNEADCLATEEALKGFDTDGSRIVLGGKQWFSKGQVLKIAHQLRERFLTLSQALREQFDAPLVCCDLL